MYTYTTHTTHIHNTNIHIRTVHTYTQHTISARWFPVKRKKAMTDVTTGLLLLL